MSWRRHTRIRFSVGSDSLLGNSEICVPLKRTNRDSPIVCTIERRLARESVLGPKPIFVRSDRSSANARSGRGQHHCPRMAYGLSQRRDAVTSSRFARSARLQGRLPSLFVSRSQHIKQRFASTQHSSPVSRTWGSGGKRRAALSGYKMLCLSTNIFALYRTGLFVSRQSGSPFPHLPQVRENWRRMLSAGESLLYVLTSGDKSEGRRPLQSGGPRKTAGCTASRL